MSQPISEIECPSDYSLFSPIETNAFKIVRRSVQIDTIFHYLEDTSVVYVSGPKNIGKTTILTQIFNDVKADSISLFISEDKSETITDSDIYKDLYVQVKTMINGVESVDLDKEITKEELKKIFISLSYFVKKKKRKIYFVLDGVFSLECISKDFLADLFFMLPVTDEFKYIISSGEDKPRNIMPVKSVKNFSISVMDFDEVKELLPTVLDEDIILIKSGFGFIPERISTIARLVSSGVSIAAILQNPSNEFDALYETEWNHVINDDLSLDIVGYLSFCIGGLSVESLSMCTNKSTSEISLAINRVSFLFIGEQSVEFSSSGYKSFCKAKLNSKRNYYIDGIIAAINENESEGKLGRLPIYYNEKGDNVAVLKHIDDKYICEVFESSYSLNEVHRNVNIGLEASINEGYGIKSAKFFHIKCGLSSINTSEALVSQLKCYLTENDIKSAIELIDSSKSNEEKLQLYCLYCIHMKDIGVDILDEIVNKVDFLFDKIDAKNLGVEKVTDIAADLLPVFPEKALKIINELDELDATGQNKSDYAFMKLSLVTLQRHGDSFTNDLNDTSSFGDSKVSMFEAVNVFKPNSPVTKIVEYIEQFKEPGDKIFILREWLKRNSHNPNAILILEKTLIIIAETIDFSIDATLYSDISGCLMVCEPNEKNVSFKKILAQIDRLRDKGPTVDYCKVCLIIVFFELKCELKNGMLRLEALISYLLELNDNSVVLASFSIIDGFIVKNIEDCPLDIKLKVKLEKDRIVQQLIDSDAYHIDVFKDAIWYEAQHSIDNAILWGGKLNNKLRRSKAISIALESYFKNLKNSDKKEKSVNDLISLLRRVGEESDRESLYLLFVSKYEILNPSKSNFKKIIRVVNKIEHSAIKVRCLVKLISVCIELNIDFGGIELFKSYINTAIDNVDANHNKIELCFFIHEKLFKSQFELANYFKSRAIEITTESGYSNEGYSDYILNAIDLSTRALFILIQNGVDDADDLNNMLESLEPVSSFIDRTRQLARLASAYQKGNQNSGAERIVEQKILPILDSYNQKKSKEFSFCAYFSLPIIFIYNPTLFHKYFNYIGEHHCDLKDKIVKRTIDYIYDNCLIGDPYEPIKNHKVLINYSSLLNIQTLINYLIDDGNIIYEIRRFFNAVNSLKKQKDISKTQISDIVEKLKDDFYGSFPREGFITHNGYEILLFAQVKNFDEKMETLTWQQLIEMARLIPNVSDRAFTISEIGSLLPDRQRDQKVDLYKEAEALIDELSSSLERVNRYRTLCDNSRVIDNSLAKSQLTKAFKLCGKNDIDENSRVRLQAIDMAHKFGQAFASSLVGMFDDDPARQKLIKQQMDSKRKDEDYKKRFEKNENLDSSISDSKVADLAWDQLGTINANSGHCSKGFDVGSYLSHLKSNDIVLYYKIISYYIHALYKLHPGKKNAVDLFRPIFNDFISNSRTVTSIYASKSSRIAQTDPVENKKYIVINDGEKEKAVEFMKKWFVENHGSNLTLIDPYFSLSDLEVVADVINKDPDVSLNIVTSLESYQSMVRGFDDGLEPLITNYWNDSISKSSLPQINFLFISYGKDNKFPLHDRWWLANESTITVGTSISGLGMRTSQISVLDLDNRIAVDDMVSPFLEKKQRFYQDEKLKYKAETF
ncbi:ATP-binding protein [Shewanella frigidimarina]|uniref:Uncharacterized protein n=1 Tax=Shewanella frigidimarina TaxID=56812 RepID=A0A106BWF5_SHEFR|nr:ATP-binding protein [Shewanella frigidimarina]KVW99877.1 hypothetical protein AWJ07_11285 [Shewanella frigidimarina]